MPRSMWVAEASSLFVETSTGKSFARIGSAASWFPINANMMWDGGLRLSLREAMWPNCCGTMMHAFISAD